MPTSPSEEELVQQSRFIFRGNVQKLKAANVADMDAKDKSKSIIVRLDEIIQAPETFANYTGRDVTVKLRGGKKLKVGDRAVFYTNGWIMGDNLAVEEVGHRPIEGAALTFVAATDDPARNLAARDVQERLTSADVVVTGRVASIRIPEDAEESGLVSSALDKPARRSPISEHNPKWREAVVEVADVEKGAHAKKNIVVRFPSSDDVRWYKAPKFYPGQEGVFILHKTQKVSATADERAPATVTDEEAETTDAFTALHPADFQPLKQREQVKTLIKTSPDTDNG
ncbi:MAG: hypothetical protein H0W99_05565 [Acidobacteria bacterium]|nr:hypothetical protein [Acidobacteriota bacterium]